MRKSFIYALLLTAALLLPKSDVELGKMKPVETVSLRNRDGLVIVETDTEDVGMGITLEEALENLRKTTAGRIYLDTAAFLLLDPEMTDQAEMLRGNLKGSVRLCECSGEVDVKEAGEYLRCHSPKVELKDWKKGMRLQILETENGRMKLS